MLPAGPTVVDMLANAAFYFGLVKALADEERPIWTQMPFSVAEDNFHAAARRGINAPVWWPRIGEIRVTELLLDTLLPRAAEGLDQFGVDAGLRDKMLGIIEQRCRTGQNGSAWQVDTVRRLEELGYAGRSPCARCSPNTSSSSGATSLCTPGPSSAMFRHRGRRIV